MKFTLVPPVESFPVKKLSHPKTTASNFVQVANPLCA